MKRVYINKIKTTRAYALVVYDYFFLVKVKYVHLYIIYIVLYLEPFFLKIRLAYHMQYLI